MFPVIVILPFFLILENTYPQRVAFLPHLEIEIFLKTLDDMYEVPFLNRRIAKELFMRHGFPDQGAAPSHLEILVDAIVVNCDGLPLTLENIGKRLLRRDKKQDWEQTLFAFGRADSVTGLNERLWERLELNFINLQEKEQHIFLDVAAFFCGNDNCTLGEAKVAWKAVYAPVNERLLWRTLVDRSLVYDVRDTQIIQMHEQLLDLGRKHLAKRNKKRRVSDEKEAMDLFQTTTQRHDQGIFSLRWHLSETRKPTPRIARRALLSLKELRCLEVDGNVTIYGDKEDKVVPFPTNLVFVSLRGVRRYFIQVFFDSSIFTRLVVLRLSDYDGNIHPSLLSNLSTLEILKLIDCNKFPTQIVWASVSVER